MQQENTKWPTSGALLVLEKVWKITWAASIMYLVLFWIRPYCYQEILA